MGSGLSPRRRSTTVAAALLALPILAALALITVTPEHIDEVRPDIVFGLVQWAQDHLGMHWLSPARAERVGNVLLYIPIGVLAYLILPRRAWFAALMVGPLLSASVEAFQWLFLPDRTASIGDVVANSLGAMIGVAAASLCTLVFAQAPSSAAVRTTA
ncbi:MAG: VanZ family protein [Microbacterium sp.]